LPEQKTLTLPPNLYLGLLPFQIFDEGCTGDEEWIVRLTLEDGNI
jgi:hypothetical protein